MNPALRPRTRPPRPWAIGLADGPRSRRSRAGSEVWIHGSVAPSWLNNGVGVGVRTMIGPNLTAHHGPPTCPGRRGIDAALDRDSPFVLRRRGKHCTYVVW